MSDDSQALCVVQVSPNLSSLMYSAIESPEKWLAVVIHGRHWNIQSVPSLLNSLSPLFFILKQSRHLLCQQTMLGLWVVSHVFFLTSECQWMEPLVKWWFTLNSIMDCLPLLIPDFPGILEKLVHNILNMPMLFYWCKGGCKTICDIVHIVNKCCEHIVILCGRIAVWMISIVGFIVVSWFYDWLDVEKLCVSHCLQNVIILVWIWMQSSTMQCSICRTSRPISDNHTKPFNIFHRTTIKET